VLQIYRWTNKSTQSLALYFPSIETARIAVNKEVVIDNQPVHLQLGRVCRIGGKFIPLLSVIQNLLETQYKTLNIVPGI
jgi:hypothetical protein